MSIRTSVTGLFAGLPDIVALVGSRVYPDAVPQGAIFPCGLVRFEELHKLYTLDGDTGCGAGSVIFSTLSYNKAETQAGGQATNQQFDGLKGPIGDALLRNACKKLDEADQEHPAPDGSNKTLFECIIRYSLDYQEL